MFCWTVRYSLLDGTVFLAGQYGISCWAVRYFLLGSTVFLAGRYGIPCWAVQYSLPGAHRPKNLRFCRAFVNGSLEEGGLAPRGGANFPSGTTVFCRRVRYRFVGRYGIEGTVDEGPFLSAGTVSFDDVRLPPKRFLKRYVWGVPQGANYFGTIAVAGSGIRAGALGSLSPPSFPYAPKCVEGLFCEVRLDGVVSSVKGLLRSTGGRYSVVPRR
jgi:hypothetical protein